MNEKKKDKEIVKEAIGDPAFYNDNLGANYTPGKMISDKGVGSMKKKEGSAK